MTGSTHSHEYSKFRLLLIECRQEAGLTQVALAERLGKPQSFVSKYERGERRLDFVEFLEIAKALNIDFTSFIKRYKSRQ